MVTRPRSAVHGLYVIIDPQAARGRNAVDVARLALEGGASMLQWRDKQRDKGEQLADARAIAALCSQHDALFIVNDHADLAIACSANGVHLGQKDLPPQTVRSFMPAGSIIGTSTNNVEEAVRAQEAGADYVAVGSIFPTGSKETTRPASPQRLREVREAVRVPLVAIGGISEENIDEVLAAGADAVAVISAVCAADDVRAAARRLADRIREHQGGSRRPSP
jgi:thiamine-phosphate diphosphorylase